MAVDTETEAKRSPGRPKKILVAEDGDVAPVSATLRGQLKCSFGYFDDDGVPHPCDKEAEYVWGPPKGGVGSFCRQHLLEQYEGMRSAIRVG